MTETQNFDFIDYKVRVEYVAVASGVSTDYISRFIYLKLSDVSPITGQISRDVITGDTFTYEMDVTDFTNHPELVNYFYKSTNKSIDVLSVTDPSDLSEFIASPSFSGIKGRVKTVVVNSGIDDTTIDPNFTSGLAILVTRENANATADASGADVGRLIIQNTDPVIRTEELLKFSGWLFNRGDFLGQITMRQLDYPTTYWLDMAGLTQASDSKNISIGNQSGNNYVSSFFIGDESGMNYYRLEQQKRDLQNSLFQLLSIRNTYDQLTIDLAETRTKNSINSHTFCDKKKTYVKHMTMAQIPQAMQEKADIPITASFAFYREANQLQVQLYNITYVFTGT